MIEIGTRVEVTSADAEEQELVGMTGTVTSMRLGEACVFLDGDSMTTWFPLEELKAI